SQSRPNVPPADFQMDTACLALANGFSEVPPWPDQICHSPTFDPPAGFLDGACVRPPDSARATAAATLPTDLGPPGATHRAMRCRLVRVPEVGMPSTEPVPLADPPEPPPLPLLTVSRWPRFAVATAATSCRRCAFASISSNDAWSLSFC